MYSFVGYSMILKDKLNHCFLVCNLRLVFEKVKFDVRHSLKPFKDLDVVGSWNLDCGRFIECPYGKLD